MENFLPRQKSSVLERTLMHSLTWYSIAFTLLYSLALLRNPMGILAQSEFLENLSLFCKS